MPPISRARMGLSMDGTNRCARAALPLAWPPALWACRRLAARPGLCAQHRVSLGNARAPQGRPSVRVAVHLRSFTSKLHQLSPTIHKHPCLSLQLLSHVQCIVASGLTGRCVSREATDFKDAVVMLTMPSPLMPRALSAGD